MGLQPSPLRHHARLLAVAMVVAAPAGGLAFAAVEAATAATELADIIVGGPGEDSLNGLAGDDTISGLGGADYVRGLEGSDLLNGNGGDDVLDGGLGDDTLMGGRNGDSLLGGEGADLLSGDRDDDILSGGPGPDRFVLAPGSGSDIVTDFSAAEGDRVEVPAGISLRLIDEPAGVIVRLPDGSQMRLVGAKAADLTQWPQAAAKAEGAKAPSAAEIALVPETGLRRALRPVIAGLLVLFLGLLTLGLMEHRRDRG